MAAKHLGNGFLENVSVLRKAFLQGVNAVQPQELIRQYVKSESNILVINKEKYKLKQNVYIVGFGKAVIGMVRPLEELTRRSDSSSHIKEGILSVPIGIQTTFNDRSHLLPSSDTLVKIMEGAKDNIPDEDAFNAAKSISKLIEKLNADDLLIVLISGGGSALLPYPLPPLTLAEKKAIVKSLSRAGATIIELNTVRKALSATKGGKLAAMTKACTVSLILSDVINSPLDMIASGPTVVNRDPAGAAFDILNKYKVSIPDHMKIKLENEEMPKTDHSEFPHVTNILIGSNETALLSVISGISESLDNRDRCFILSSSLQGEASVVGETLSKLATVITRLTEGFDDESLLTTSILTDLCVCDDKKKEIHDSLNDVKGTKQPICLIFGGETTVHVRGPGCGGRNQEMVLSFSINLEKIMAGSQFKGEILFLSGGTDGIDGPTDAAGSVSYWISDSSDISSQLQEAKLQGLDPNSYLKNNDSYTYFSLLNDGQYLLKPGHTGTNVMDLQILLIYPRM